MVWCCAATVQCCAAAVGFGAWFWGMTANMQHQLTLMVLQDERDDASHWHQQQERDSPTKKPAHKSAGKLLRPSQQQVGKQRAKHLSLAATSSCRL
jgi:hypothetical protein